MLRPLRLSISRTLAQDSYSFELVVEVDYSVASVAVTPHIVNAGDSVTVQGSAAVDNNVTGQVHSPARP